MSFFKTVMALSVLLIAGCGHFNITPPVITTGNFCEIPHYELSVKSIPPGLSQDLMFAMEHHNGPLLFLSGGSQSGAFGAGFIGQWAKNNGGVLPEFSVVTGVSTGAILSLSAFIGEPEAAIEGYDIENENQVIERFVKQKNGKLSLGDFVKTLQKGAMADLGPFREELGYILRRYDIIKKIAIGAGKHRKLYIAVVDIDTGKAVTFDLTQMAQKIENPANTARKAFFTDCFIKAVAASSAVPLAAVPVFIDNRMYIDGGARFGVFSGEVAGVVNMYQEKMIKTHGPTPKRNVFMIFNGDQAIEPKCGKLDKTLCTPASPTGGVIGAHKDWDILFLIGRSVSVLTDQVKQFSEEKIITDSANAGYFLRSVKIEADADNHVFTAIDGTKKTCAAWKTEDKILDNPLEFHPRFMRCLIDYGKAKAIDAAW